MNSADTDTSAADSLASLEATACVGPIAHLPVWSNITPERARSGLDRLLAESEAAFDELERNGKPTWEGLMRPLERLQDRLGRVFGAVLHLTSVKYSDELQAAYDAVRPRYVALANRMAQSRAVYEALVAIRDGAEYGRLDQAQRRILTESIRGMERAGVHLTGDARRRYQEIQERLSDLGNRFQIHLVKEEQTARVRVGDRARVAGVPKPVLELAAQTARNDGVAEANETDGPWHFVVNAVSYQAVLEHAQDRSLREELYRAFRSRGTRADLDNRPVLEEMLRLRQEQARLVGFPNYAARSIDAKMAPSVDAVWALLEEIERAARPVAERELAELKAFMASRGAAEVEDLAPWDVPYWSERLREARYAYDSEALREYFQLPKVMDGLFSLVETLYGVAIRRLRDANVPVWDESVEFYEVLRDGEVIAGFYMDPYARPGEKRAGAWMNTVVDRSRVLAPPGRSSSLPVALFVMNARPPAAGRPALLSLDEVRTLFHEFGHATQHMFTQIEEGGASGMNLVEWDAVELASQFNEYWLEHEPFLRALSAHVDTGEPLDDETLERIVASRNFLIGNATLRQLQFAKTDLALHERYGLPDGNEQRSPYRIEAEIAAETLVLPRLPDETQLPSFGHLFAGGYAAGYYSYKWAEVLAADAFAAFREAGLDDEARLKAVAERFRDTVLGLGGSLPAAEVYRRFRGRDATPEALLVEQGLRPAA
ncbi:MAG TPA: M3 family metallopeptidase [Pseudomonadales bacterium]